MVSIQKVSPLRHGFAKPPGFLRSLLGDLWPSKTRCRASSGWPPPGCPPRHRSADTWPLGGARCGRASPTGAGRRAAASCPRGAGRGSLAPGCASLPGYAPRGLRRLRGGVPLPPAPRPSRPSPTEANSRSRRGDIISRSPRAGSIEGSGISLSARRSVRPSVCLCLCVSVSLPAWLACLACLPGLRARQRRTRQAAGSSKFQKIAALSVAMGSRSSMRS